jgi:DNA mismatch repair ATPase MutS
MGSPDAYGKSTLLKTVAVNAIFAQSICTCLAQKYSSCFYTVFTSMALRDNVRDGESYFVAEVRSIKRILDHLNDQVPCLCLIDEVLRGTNTVERIAASSQVLLYLAKSNCLCMAATHDIELTYILEDYYQNVHFQETIVDDRIVFDYMLYDGRAMSSNAIRLLRLMGYDEAIVREAENRAGLFMSQGNWKGILSPECGSKPPS